MFAVIFEVNPKPERRDDYLGNAKLLKPELEKIDGFIANERYASQRRKGWLVSLSLWRDEKALIRWRTLALHHEVQAKGRAEIFADYHLRVDEIIADTGAEPGVALVQQRFDETAVGAAKIATLTERPLDRAAGFGGATPPLESDLFESITRPGQGLILGFWRDLDAARAGIDGAPGRHRTVRIIRDYGMFARTEAPQYYPAVAARVD
jgi:heme-degrading monooxygenase HmoA